MLLVVQHLLVSFCPVCQVLLGLRVFVCHDEVKGESSVGLLPVQIESP